MFVGHFKGDFFDDFFGLIFINGLFLMVCGFFFAHEWFIRVDKCLLVFEKYLN